MWWKGLILILIGFGAGGIVAGGVFGFIAGIGIIPTMANKTKTSHYIPLYEDCITAGGVFGTLSMIFHFQIPLGSIAVVISALLIGIFVGTLAVSLAEVIDVFPVMTERVSIKQGVAILLLSIALGKLIGSLAHFLVLGVNQ
ncbi:MAG: stage V sporulation protein AB [Epulopiscium sp.]|nr:stage V sporulation protein AB [Candidatus Epulonipiscium sp.]